PLGRRHVRVFPDVYARHRAERPVLRSGRQGKSGDSRTHPARAVRRAARLDQRARAPLRRHVSGHGDRAARDGARLGQRAVSKLLAHQVRRDLRAVTAACGPSGRMLRLPMRTRKAFRFGLSRRPSALAAALLAAVGLAVAAGLFSPAAAQELYEVNLLTNPGFETGGATPRGWLSVNSELPRRDTSRAYAGQASGLLYTAGAE